MDEIADLTGLKAWLQKRQAFLTQRERAVSFGLSFPRGVLLLGVQGCGKSLCAKAVAQEWRLPLLKLDPSSLSRTMAEKIEALRDWARTAR